MKNVICSALVVALMLVGSVVNAQEISGCSSCGQQQVFSSQPVVAAAPAFAQPLTPAFVSTSDCHVCSTSGCYVCPASDCYFCSTSDFRLQFLWAAIVCSTGLLQPTNRCSSAYDCSANNYGLQHLWHSNGCCSNLYLLLRINIARWITARRT